MATSKWRRIGTLATATRAVPFRQSATGEEAEVGG
jgi:hypothetical protein